MAGFYESTWECPYCGHVGETTFRCYVCEFDSCSRDCSCCEWNEKLGGETKYLVGNDEKTDMPIWILNVVEGSMATAGQARLSKQSPARKVLPARAKYAKAKQTQRAKSTKAKQTQRAMATAASEKRTSPRDLNVSFT
jgi:hypothetical protein